MMISNNMSLLLSFGLFLITATSTSAGAIHNTTGKLQEMADILSMATTEELEDVPDAVLDLVFHPPPSIMKEEVQEVESIPLSFGDETTTTARSLSSAGPKSLGLGFVGCFRRELKAFAAQFDPLEYKQFILSKAGVSERDIFQAVREGRGNGNKIRSNPSVKALLETLDGAEELQEMDAIYVACEQEGNEENNGVEEEKEAKTASGYKSAEGIGAQIGQLVLHTMHNSIDANNRGRRFLENRSNADDVQPRQGPAVGFHLEIGAIIDYSISVSSTTARNCFGLELCGGAELGLIVSWGQLDDATIGFEIDAGLGPHFGFAYNILCFQYAFFELTIGAGVGAGLGTQICFDFP